MPRLTFSVRSSWQSDRLSTLSLRSDQASWSSSCCSETRSTFSWSSLNRGDCSKASSLLQSVYHPSSGKTSHVGQVLRLRLQASHFVQVPVHSFHPSQSVSAEQGRVRGRDPRIGSDGTGTAGVRRRLLCFRREPNSSRSSSDVNTGGGGGSSSRQRS